MLSLYCSHFLGGPRQGVFTVSVQGDPCKEIFPCVSYCGDATSRLGEELHWRGQGLTPGTWSYRHMDEQGELPRANVRAHKKSDQMTIHGP